MPFVSPALYGYGETRQSLGPSLGPYGNYAFSQEMYRQLDYGYPPASLPMQYAGGIEPRLSGYERMGVLDLDDVFNVGGGRSQPEMSVNLQNEVVEERKEAEGSLQKRLQERPLEPLEPLEPWEPLEPLVPLKSKDPVKSKDSNSVPEQKPKETKKTQEKEVVQGNKAITKKSPIPDPATLPKIKIAGSIKPRILYLKKK